MPLSSSSVDRRIPEVLSKRRVGKGAKCHAHQSLSGNLSRYRRLKIEGGAFFLTLAVTDRGATTGNKIAPGRVDPRKEA
jgi:hypothetical protein